jgi:hypothetical protein
MRASHLGLATVLFSAHCGSVLTQEYFENCISSTHSIWVTKQVENLSSHDSLGEAAKAEEALKAFGFFRLALFPSGLKSAI